MNHEAEQPKSRQPNLWFRLQPVTCTNKRAQMHKWRGRTTNRDVQALELALAQAVLTLYAKRAIMCPKRCLRPTVKCLHPPTRSESTGEKTAFGGEEWWPCKAALTRARRG